jgi:hypothetical protein
MHKLRKKSVWSLFLEPEDGDDTFLRKDGWRTARRYIRKCRTFQIIKNCCTFLCRQYTVSKARLKDDRSWHLPGLRKTTKKRLSGEPMSWPGSSLLDRTQDSFSSNRSVFSVEPSSADKYKGFEHLNTEDDNCDVCRNNGKPKTFCAKYPQPGVKTYILFITTRLRYQSPECSGGDMLRLTAIQLSVLTSNKQTKLRLLVHWPPTFMSKVR